MWQATRIVISIFALLFATQLQADETVITTTTNPVTGNTIVEKQVITTDIPSPKVITTVPSNFVSCFKVQSGWRGDVWVAAHQVCQYANSTEGAAWVDGYWACTEYNGASCTKWDWNEAHWVKVLDVY